VTPPPLLVVQGQAAGRQIAAFRLSTDPYRRRADGGCCPLLQRS